MAKDSPGVHLPPPLIYVAFFLLSVGLQRVIPLPAHLLHPLPKLIIGVVCCTAALVLVLPALLAFLRSRNTLITFLPAKSLQTAGIYAWSRNPMYFGLLLVYTGLACSIGNLWTLFLVPLVVLAVEHLVIRKEESYLERAFGQVYLEYKGRVRRWAGRRTIGTRAPSSD